MSEPASGSATVRRMLVGLHLRRLREEKGISRLEAGFTIRASESKMSRLELGRVAFKERDISDLLVYYGVTDPEQRDEVLRLVREANRPSWEAMGRYVHEQGLSPRVVTADEMFVPDLE